MADVCDKFLLLDTPMREALRTITWSPEWLART